VIPAPFDYQAPDSVDAAVSVLGELTSSGADVKVLAGGQSLLPVLRLRLAAPEVVVDLGRIPELVGVRDDGDAIVIGAMTTHDEVVRSPLVREHDRLLSVTSETIADPQVRHRGTFGGALVHADPAGDLPAAEFFVDLFTTAVEEGELLVEVRVPKHTGWGAHYEKFSRVAQAWSIVAVAAAVRVDGGTIAEARIGLTNMGSTPVRARAVEQALVGQPATAEAVRAAAASAAEGTEPPTDANADVEYRRHLAQVLTSRAVLAATGG
jgi:carbon-monoxide dehydrogenase medium subunit